MNLKKISILFLFIFVFIILFIISFHIFNWNKTHLITKELYIISQLKNFYSNKDSPIETFFKRQFDILYFNGINLIKENPSNLSSYSINIEEAKLRKNEVIISKILQRDQTLRKQDRYWINAILENNNISYDIKMRLRGDQPNHWENKKKSWRIKIKNDEYINGYNSFSLILPSDRWLEIGHLANKLAKDYEVLALNSDYVLLKINKKNHGLYFYSENFSKNFLERHKYPDGQIFIGNDVGFDKIQKNNNNNQNFEYEFLPSSYKMLLENKNNISNSAQIQFNEFLNLIKSRDINKINSQIHKFLNIEKFSKWYSLITIFGSDHSEKIDNLPWYYNSLNGLFEPILYDVELKRRNPNSMNEALENQIIKTLIITPVIKNKIGQQLNKIIKEKNQIIDMHKNTYENIKYYIYTGIEPLNKKINSIGSVNYDDLYYSFSNRNLILKDNIKDIEKWINERRIFTENEIYLNNQNKSENLIYKLKIYNDSNLDILLKKINLKYKKNINNLQINNFTNFANINVFYRDNSKKDLTKIDNIEFKYINNKIEINLPNINIDARNNYFKTLKNNKMIDEYLINNFFKENFNKILIIKIDYDPNIKNDFHKQAEPFNIEYHFHNFHNNKKIDKSSIRSSNLLYTNEIFFNDIVKVVNNLNIKKEYSKNIEKIITTLNQNKIDFDLNEINKILTIKEGNYNLKTSLIFEKDYTLQIEKGTTLKLADGVSLLLSGPLYLNGTKNKPINITKSNINWGIISVVNSKKKSILNYSNINFGGLKNKAIIKNKHFSGMVNFFYSDVEINNSIFSNASIEDSINIKNSSYKINNTKVINNNSDGFDGDWSDGHISNSIFQNNKNDGIDISGSKVTIEKSSLISNGDKSISVGEDSKVIIENSDISDSVYGVVSKDLSYVLIKNSIFNNNLFAIAAYRKKPLFGGGSIKLDKNKLSLNKFDYVTDKFSKIIEKNEDFPINYIEHLEYLDKFNEQ